LLWLMHAYMGNVTLHIENELRLKFLAANGGGVGKPQNSKISENLKTSISISWGGGNLGSVRTSFFRFRSP